MPLLQSLFDPSIWAGAGATAIAFVGGRVTKRDARINKLEAEVEECRQRDARFVIIEAGFRMVVGEMQRDNPNSVALQMCGDLLSRKLGPAPSLGDFSELLAKLDEQDRKDEDRDPD